MAEKPDRRRRPPRDPYIALRTLEYWRVAEQIASERPGEDLATCAAYLQFTFAIVEEGAPLPLEQHIAAKRARMAITTYRAQHRRLLEMELLARVEGGWTTDLATTEQRRRNKRASSQQRPRNKNAENDNKNNGPGSEHPPLSLSPLPLKSLQTSEGETGERAPDLDGSARGRAEPTPDEKRASSELVAGLSLQGFSGGRRW